MNNNYINTSPTSNFPTMNDIFWLYNYSNDNAIAAFEFNDIIFLAFTKKRLNYELDLRNKIVLKKDEIEPFITKMQNDGYSLIFNVLSETYNSIGTLKSNYIKKNITLQFNTYDIRNFQKIIFNYTDVNLLIIDEKTNEIYSKFEASILAEDFSIDDSNYKNYLKEDLYKRINGIIKENRIKHPEGIIPITILSRYFQSIRAALHYSLYTNDIELLKLLDQTFGIKNIEPCLLFVIVKYIWECNEDISKYIVDNYNISNYPWDSISLQLLNSANRSKFKERENQIKTKSGLILYSRYF